MASVHARKGAQAREKGALSDALKFDPSYYRARVDLARALILAGTPQPALELLDQAPSFQKRKLPILIQRNWALLALNRHQELRAGIDEISASATVPEVVLQDGLLRARTKEYAASQRLLEAYLRERPDDMRAIRALAGLYAVQDQMPAGLRRISEHVSRYPHSAALQEFLGTLYLANGKLAEGRAAFQTAKTAAPEAIEPDLQLADLDIRERKLDDARQRLAQLVVRAPQLTKARFLLATVEQLAGNPVKAIEEYRTVLASEPNNTVALNNLADLLTDHDQRYDEAIELAGKAIAIDPGFAAAYDTLGWAYYRKGRYDTAVRHLEQAMQKQASPRRKFHLALAYVRSGDRERGLTMYQEAISADAKLAQGNELRLALAGAR